MYKNYTSFYYAIISHRLQQCVRPIVRVMRLTVLLLFTVIMQASAVSYAQNVTLKDHHITLKQLFKEVRRQTGYNVFYQYDQVNTNATIDVDFKNTPLKEVMKKSLSGQQLDFNIYENTVVIEKKDKVNSPTLTVITPAKIDVQGIVLDENGKSLPGVTIVIKGTQISAATDNNGQFFLRNVEEGAVLLISFVGYDNQEIPASAKVTIKLVPKLAELSEVVVVAYGKQKKATLTGAVTQVSGEEVAKSPVTNINNALQGRLPGLQFQQTSGQPGSDGASVNIRGFGSALTIVDGVATDISQLNPNDIESITVLKDGAAAMYGFKAANGAIIVTTKHGKTGAPVLSLDIYRGLQGNAVAYPKLLNAGQFVELSDEAAINIASAQNPNGPLPSLPYSQEDVQKWIAGTAPGYQSTDWHNLIFKNYAPLTNASLSIRGGTDATKYFISGGLLDQGGLLRSNTSKFKRYNFRSNVDFKISKRLKASFNVSGRLENTLAPPGPGITDGGGGTSVVSALIRAYPIYTPYANNNTNYFGATNVIGVNPLATASTQAGYYNNSEGVLNASGTIEYQIPYIDGLTASLNYNYEYDNTNSKTWLKQYSLYNYSPSSGAYNVVSTANSPSNLNQYNYQGGIPSDLQLSLKYDHTFGADHHLTGLLLLQKTKTNSDGYSVQRNFSLDALDQLQLGDILNQTINVNNPFSQTAYMGYAARINYDYKAKYLAEFGGRYDYSWKFPNGAGFFPEISAGWVISKENFFKVPFISNLKLKLSWARTPDDANFNGFNYISGYNYPSGSYLFTAGAPTNGLQVGSYANPNLTWLVGTLYNGGLEWGMWNGMITGEFNVFYRKRTGLPATVQVTYPSVTGINPPQANLNQDNTRGFELQLSFNKKFGDFGLTFSPNVAYSRTRNGFQVNPPAGSAWSNYTGGTAYRNANLGRGYIAIGQFQNQQQINSAPIQDGEGNLTLRPGDIRYKDINGDGVINGDDQTTISRGTFPQLQYGLNTTLSYKGFDLSVLFAGASEFDVNEAAELQDPLFNGSNTFQFFTDRWHHENIFDPNSPWIPGKYPSTIVGGSNNNNQASTFWTKSGTYLRLKTLDLGYSLSKSLLQGTGIGSARFYFSGQNLFILTGVKYLDPENLAGNGRGSFYPIQKVFSLGLNLTF